MERVAFGKLMAHLSDNQVLDSRQSAYRAHHSVETVLASLTDHILRQMDNGKVTALVLLDVSAAFDTISHPILIERLKSFGITSLALDWFTSYLNDRFQRISIDGVDSDPVPLIHGVPQGSVGGPLLFSIYTQPLGELIRRHSIGHHTYADDTQLFLSFHPCEENFISVIKRLEECAADVQSWMTANNLKLNENKSEFILLGSRAMLNKLPQSVLTVGNSSLHPKESCRNLGVTIDANMTLAAHISGISRSVRFQLRNLSHIRKFLTRRATESVVHSLISSRLDFCNVLLYNLPDYQLRRLQRLQNSAARLVTLTKSASHISPILCSLHWLPLRERVIFKILLLVFQSLNGTAPSYIEELIQPYQPARQLRSTNTGLLSVPRTQHSWGNRAFSAAGPSLWNAIPLSLRKLTSYSQFKTQLKTHLFANV